MDDKCKATALIAVHFRSDVFVVGMIIESKVDDLSLLFVEIFK